nr:MAG TPA: hypothetical protein [Caudoviricetes sp.]
MVVILALDILQVSKGLIRMNDVWDKIGAFFGRMLALTMAICAWLLVIVFTLKLIWFILFRILV